MEDSKILEMLATPLTIGQLAKKLSSPEAELKSKDLRKTLAKLRTEGKVVVEGAKRSAKYMVKP